MNPLTHEWMDKLKHPIAYRPDEVRCMSQRESSWPGVPSDVKGIQGDDLLVPDIDQDDLPHFSAIPGVQAGRAGVVDSFGGEFRLGDGYDGQVGDLDSQHVRGPEVDVNVAAKAPVRLFEGFQPAEHRIVPIHEQEVVFDFSCP